MPHLGSKTRVSLLSDSCSFVDVGRPLDKTTGLSFNAVHIQFWHSTQSVVNESASLWIPTVYNFTCNSNIHVCTIYTRTLAVSAWHSRSCSNSCSSCYNGCLVTWTVLCLTAAMLKPLVGLRLFRCREHLHFHDIVWPLFVVCTIPLCNHGTWKAMSNSWTGVHLGNLTMVRRN
jgi:hypothetical protein